MGNVRKNLLQFIFSGAYLMRWNDKLRPMDLQEIDKQAHKLILAFILWQENSRSMTVAEKTALGQKIIEGALFDYFYRLVITDIKPPVFYKLKENPDHYRQLTKFVLSRLEPVLSPLGRFWDRLQEWHLNLHEEGRLYRRILEAAHLYASQWEFRIIKPNNFFDEEMEPISQSFTERLDSFRTLAGINSILDNNNALGRFATLCGQLRFQIRWTQVPRIPATSVLGHMFIVASFAYFFSQSVGACQARANNNFFAGLFHDLPELLTRDIISPVKQSVASLPRIIKEYENSELERRILGPLREDGFDVLVSRLSYLLGLEIGSEFRESCRLDGRIEPLDSFYELHKKNFDQADPKDGQLLKVCDWLAAFIEAHSSIRNGVSSPHLVEAQGRLRENILASPLESLQLSSLLADFD